MDMADIGIFAVLEWIYDRVEQRFGKLAAWVVTLSLTAAIVAAIVAALTYIFR
jgi:hypothetical protein